VNLNPNQLWDAWSVVARARGVDARLPVDATLAAAMGEAFAGLLPWDPGGDPGTPAPG